MMPSYVAKWPFLFIVDSNYASTGWVLLNAPIVTYSRQEQFADLRRYGFRFVGMSSDGTFPQVGNNETLDYGAVCEAWCHCFREPDRYLPKGAPRALISISDFTDYRHVSPEAVSGVSADVIPHFDFIYVGALVPWKSSAKNWQLARSCIPRICHELGLRGLLIGTPMDELPESSVLTFVQQLPWHVFLAYLARARFLFVPNELDASPRVLTESLCLDVPIVVNRKILGGWKYVNTFTGSFFDGPKNVVSAVSECLGSNKSPRNWFRANYGPYLAGHRLLDLLRSIDPALREPSYLHFGNRIDALPPVCRG